MNPELARPRVEELFFHLFTRPVHPELFETLAYRRVDRGDYTLSIRITPAGHVLTWTRADIHFTEITASKAQSLPSSGSKIQHRVQCGRSRALPPISGIVYQMSSQVEVLPPEVFLHVHEEIIADGRKRGLLFCYPPHHRLSLPPLGFVTVDETRRCLSVATFHTFPNELAVVKTQSIIDRS
jgi:hypothetical protein